MPVPLTLAVALLAGPPRLVGYLGSHLDVRCLTLHESRLYAGTECGLLVQRDKVWEPVSPPLLGIVVAFDGRVASLASGAQYRLEDGAWKLAGHGPVPAAGDVVRAATSQGEASVRLGDSHITLEGATPLAAPGALAVYCLLESGGTLYAGTTDGVFARKDDAWVPEQIDAGLPTARFQGAAVVGGVWVAGGPAGLFRGLKGDWLQWDDRPVRQVVIRDEEPWVLFGDGSVDKVDINTNRRVSNVLLGAAKRPWASCLGLDGDTVLFGGQGGWVEKTSKGVVERRPAELERETVTAVARQAGRTYLGTQQTGLWEFGGATLRNWGIPAGMEDSWVTCVLPLNGAVYVGTANGGIYSLRDGRLVRFPAPTKRVTCLAASNGRLAAGGMDGAWVRMASGWVALLPQPVEATCIVPDVNHLYVFTPYGAVWLEWDMP